MKTQSFSLRSLLPTLLCCLIALPIVGFSEYSNAAQKKPAVVKTVVQAVSINSANAEVIAEALKGIGLKKAQAIVSWRKQHGKFTSIEQLLDIKGIGEKTLAANKGRIKL